MRHSQHPRPSPAADTATSPTGRGWEITPTHKEQPMQLFSKLRDFLLRKTPITTSVPMPAMSLASKIDTVPPFDLGIAELMRFDPQIRIGLGARNGLLMSAEVEVGGGPADARAWVQAQWNRIWTTSAPQLLRTKLYGFL